MEVLEGADDLRDVEVEGLPRVDDRVHVADLRQELAALQVLQNEVEARGVLEGAVQPHDEGVVLLREPLQDLLLPLDVLDLLRSLDVGLLDGLQRVEAL